jgi:tetraacyldisaccharide 4'-kinase
MNRAWCSRRAASRRLKSPGMNRRFIFEEGAAHLGVGADRYRCGERLLASLDADVLVLDDGFQHWRLDRDLDIVLIDAWDPFGGGAVFPQGRLREELDALSRADAFVITRTLSLGFEPMRLSMSLRRWNATRRCSGRAWRRAGGGGGDRREVEALPGGAVAAFCGLANPRPFWRTFGIARAGCAVPLGVRRSSFLSRE